MCRARKSPAKEDEIDSTPEHYTERLFETSFETTINKKALASGGIVSQQVGEFCGSLLGNFPI